MRQRGMTLIEVLVVLGILSTIAGIVAVMIPKVNFARDKTLWMEHVRTLASLLEMGGRSDLSGPDWLLHLADHGELRGADSLGKLFCPGDPVERFPGADAYVREGREAARLTSYAGRDAKHPEWSRQRMRNLSAPARAAGSLPARVEAGGLGGPAPPLAVRS